MKRFRIIKKKGKRWYYPQMTFFGIFLDLYKRSDAFPDQPISFETFEEARDYISKIKKGFEEKNKLKREVVWKERRN